MGDKDYYRFRVKMMQCFSWKKQNCREKLKKMLKKLNFFSFKCFKWSGDTSDYLWNLVVVGNHVKNYKFYSLGFRFMGKTSRHTFRALYRSDCFVDSASLEVPFSKTSYEHRTKRDCWIVIIIWSLLSMIKLDKSFHSLWWLLENVLRDRAALSAASCSSPVWGEPSTRRRLVETRRLDRPRPPAQRFQPGVREHPDTENTFLPNTIQIQVPRHLLARVSLTHWLCCSVT